MASPSTQTILITGANGYVAGNVVKATLEKGYNVRGTVRSESSAKKLRETFPEYSSQLSIAIVKDMTNPDNYKDAFEGVTGVFHTASPFILSPKDVRKELLDPAIEGAVGILEAAKKYGSSVKRVINLSSFAANLDVLAGYRQGYTYTDADWNPMTYDEAAATSNGSASYCASKGLAEKAMWDWTKKNEVPFTLTSINPAWVFGPIVGSVDVKHLGESMEAMYKLLDASSLPSFDFGGFVDARDLSRALISAYETPAAAGERFITASHFDWQTVVDAVRKELPQVESRLPKERSEIDLVDGVYAIDASRAKKVLGLEFTPLNITVRDVYQQLLAAESSA